MKTITVRDLRSQSARIWKDLPKEKDMVVTSNGRPVGILLAASSDTLDQTLTTLRRTRAQMALAGLQLESVRKGKHKLSSEAIDRVIADVRRRRRS